MAEPATSTAAVIASALGLTVFGVATGLHPSLLIAGLAGGMWALFYLSLIHISEPTRRLRGSRMPSAG